MTAAATPRASRRAGTTLALVLMLGPWADAGAGPGPTPSSARDLEVLAGLIEEFVLGRTPEAREHYRRAGSQAAPEARWPAALHEARVLLRTGDLKGFEALTARIGADRRLPAEARARASTLRRARDELARERRSTVPASGARGSPSPPRPPPAIADVRLADAALEEALATLGQTFGATVVCAPSDQRVTLHLEGTTLARGLLAIAFQTGLTARRVGRTWYLGPPGRLDAALPATGSEAPEPVEAACARERRSPPRPRPADTVDIVGVPLGEALRRLADALGTWAVAPRSSRRVTLHLRAVDPQTAYKTLASQLGWGMRRVYDIHFLGPPEVLSSRFPGLVSRTITLRRISVGEVFDDVQDLAQWEALGLTHLEMDVVDNTLAVEGPKASVERVSRFIEGSDLERRTVELAVSLAARAGQRTVSLPARRIRVLERIVSVITLDVPSAGPGPSPEQVVVELCPRLEPKGRITLDIRWRITEARGGVIQDVWQGLPVSVGATVGTTVEVPITGQRPGGQLSLRLQPRG